MSNLNYKKINILKKLINIIIDESIKFNNLMNADQNIEFNNKKLINITKEKYINEFEIMLRSNKNVEKELLVKLIHSINQYNISGFIIGVINKTDYKKLLLVENNLAKFINNKPETIINTLLNKKILDIIDDQSINIDKKLVKNELLKYPELINTEINRDVNKEFNDISIKLCNKILLLEKQIKTNKLLENENNNLLEKIEASLNADTIILYQLKLHSNWNGKTKFELDETIYDKILNNIRDHNKQNLIVISQDTFDNYLKNKNINIKEKELSPLCNKIKELLIKDGWNGSKKWILDKGKDNSLEYYRCFYNYLLLDKFKDLFSTGKDKKEIIKDCLKLFVDLPIEPTKTHLIKKNILTVKDCKQILSVQFKTNGPMENVQLYNLIKNGGKYCIEEGIYKTIITLFEGKGYDNKSIIDCLTKIGLNKIEKTIPKKIKSNFTLNFPLKKPGI